MATSSNEPKAEAKDGKTFYGYLFTKAKPIPAPTPVFDALLRAIALHIAHNTGDKSEPYLTPTKLGAFYKAGGHDWDSFFIEMPHPGISTVYQGLGCQHMLLPNSDDFAPPSVPALTMKGFVQWQTIQTLLEPEIQVPVLQFAVANWALKHPDTGTPFPADLPKESLPSSTDTDTDCWYKECVNRARMKAAEEEAAETPKEHPKSEFTERKVNYSHVNVKTASPAADYFGSRPINVAYVHIPSPRVTPTRRSPERERDLARERDHLSRRRTTSSEESARRRSFSDYPSSPHGTRSVRVPHVVSEHTHLRRGHSQPRHYSSESESDTPPSSSRGGPRRTQRSNEPTPITIHRVYTNSSEDSPRVIRTTMPPPPIPSHMHSPRPPSSGRVASSHDESKRRTTLFDITQKLSSFINPGGAQERTRSTSGSRGRRDGLGSGRGSREDILPSSRLSQSWSDIDTDYDESEDERRRFDSRRHSRENKEPARDRDRDRERERERELTASGASWHQPRSIATVAAAASRTRISRPHGISIAQHISQVPVRADTTGARAATQTLIGSTQGGGIGSEIGIGTGAGAGTTAPLRGRCC
ncbi:hypothetical protein VTJ49DRAFT_96 [Mycothermus thermophilus]|uniref:DUF7514 domain-containing protein n=1 Tax=Humicola insolens TaxID=85995 RepID=A0ABR3VQF1_HUMIN